ncbi:MAG: hypothetical protein WKG00_28960 [Polyangiaceae bacterium]
MRRLEARRLRPRPDAARIGAAIAAALLLLAGAVAAQTPGSSPGGKPLPAQPALPPATPPQPALPSPTAAPGTAPIAPTATGSAARPGDPPPATVAPGPALERPTARAGEAGKPDPARPKPLYRRRRSGASRPIEPPVGATADRARGTAAASASAASDKRPPYPETPARTPLPPGSDAKELPWKRHLEIGGDLAFVQRAASEDKAGDPSGIRYAPAFGFGVHARWELFKYLRFTAYFLDAAHAVDMPAGTGYLGQSAASSYEIDKVHTFSLGARLSPTLPLTDRARAWLTLGVGWGRLEFGEMEITEGGRVITVDDRAEAFVEFPLGVGASFDLVPRWLSLEVEITGALVADQPGDALDNVQGHDNEGHLHDIGGFPGVDGTFVQTVGLSLVL